MQPIKKTVIMIGRQNELTQLQEYVESCRPEFIALYGRRRVGKTYLVNQFFDNRFALSISGVIGGGRDEQMAAFMQGLRELGYIGRRPKSWMDAFFELSKLLEAKMTSGNRCVIFIDELPCFDTPKAGFVRALGHFWNSWAEKHSQVMLIVCGSATSWMIKNIIDNHGGLHNRITHEMHLHPFTLCETEQMLQSKNISWDRLSVTQIYMALGGIPYYLDMIKRDDSVASAMDRLFFSKDGGMADEYNRLFSSLFNNPAPYLEILRALSSSIQGITREQILKLTSMPDNGHVSDYLSNLIKCDFVRYYYVKNKKIKKTDGLYQLTDFFTIFYNTFLSKPITNEHYWSNNLNTPSMNTWLGLAFERVCMAHIPQIKKAIGIDQIGTEYYSWRSNDPQQGAQVDLLIERADRIINLCEIKYSTVPYAIDKEEDLKFRTRQGAFVAQTGTRYGIQPTMISPYGLARNTYYYTMQKVITLDDLFQAN